MNFKKLSLLTAAGAIALLAGCNIFNPNGEEESSCPSNNAECYVTLGQSLVQQKKFDAAMTAYKNAVAIDSTKSEGYWGYATAATFKYNVNLGSLLNDLQSAAQGDPSSFTHHSDDELTARIRMSKAVVDAMQRLSDRDTLSKWYGYIKDSTNSGADPYFGARRAFIIHYLDTVTAPSRQRSEFPLSDRKRVFNDAIIQFAPYKMMYTILSVYDANDDDTFDERDRVLKNLLGTNGNLGDIANLADQMRDDPVLQNQINDKIVAFQSGLGDMTQLLAYFSLSPTDTSGSSAQAQSKGQMDSTITSLGGSLVFYQFGDRLDNDADGCIDEELVDGFDNDLDGFVDEDARLIEGTTSSTGDKLNNDLANGQDDFRENLAGDFPPGNKRPYVLTWVGDYLASHDEVNTEESQTTWVYPNAKKGGSMVDFRIRLQADSLAVRLTPGQTVPSQYQAKLDSAKTLVGGCWRNY